VSFVSRVGRTAWSMAVGHWITLRELFRRPVTVLYPEEKPAFPRGSRSVPVLKTNEETGLLNCTSCGLCERSCPPSCIHIVQAVDPETGKKKPWPASFTLDLSHCMVCNLCVEACPFDALEMADVVELSSYRLDDLKLEKEDLAALWKTSRAARVAGGEPI
jgi:NADH-quinone oxidoreductase subunit I